MKRWFGLNFTRRVQLPAAALSAVFLLAGCGGLGFGRIEPVEVHFAYIDQAADYQPLADLFHKEYPNITVVLEPVPLDNQPVRTLQERAREVDAIRISSMVTGEDLLDAFLPLDGMIATDEGIRQEDFFTGSLEGLEVDGKLLGLPAGLNPFVVYYLPEKFSAAGVAVPSASWTLEDFVAAAMAVHNVDETALNSERYTYGFCSHPALPDLAMFSYLFGGGLFDDNFLSASPTLNRPENVQALGWYASLANDFGLMPEGDLSTGVVRMLYGRRCGFWVDFLTSSIYGEEPLEGAALLPLPSYVSSFNIAWQEAYFILASSEHSTEAYQWIRFLMEQPSAAGTLIPPLKPLIASEEYGQFAPEQVLAVARNLPDQTVILGLETYRDDRFGNALQLFSEAAERVIEDGIDPQMALDEAQRRAEAGGR